MNTNDIIKVAVTVTMCVALLGVGGLVYVGKADANVFVTFVLTTFAGMTGGVAGVSLIERGTKQGVNAVLNVMQARESMESKE